MKVKLFMHIVILLLLSTCTIDGQQPEIQKFIFSRASFGAFEYVNGVKVVNDISSYND